MPHIVHIVRIVRIAQEPSSLDPDLPRGSLPLTQTTPCFWVKPDPSPSPTTDETSVLVEPLILLDRSNHYSRRLGWIYGHAQTPIEMAWSLC